MILNKIRKETNLTRAILTSPTLGAHTAVSVAREIVETTAIMLTVWHAAIRLVCAHKNEYFFTLAKVL